VGIGGTDNSLAVLELSGQVGVYGKRTGRLASGVFLGGCFFH